MIHQPITVSSNVHMQPNTCKNEAFSSTSTRFNPYFGWCCCLYVYTSQSINLVDVLENASFVHVFGCMCMLELTITGWWIIVAYLSIPNWFELQLVSQLASYLFSYFLLRSLLPFSNLKFLPISCTLTKTTITYLYCLLYTTV